MERRLLDFDFDQEAIEKRHWTRGGFSTLERWLKDCTYSYKQPRKGIPSTAPSKEEILARVQEIAQQILDLKKDSG